MTLNACNCTEHNAILRRLVESTRQDLEKLSVKQLQDQCRYFNVLYPDYAGKAELIDLLLGNHEYHKAIAAGLDVTGYIPYKYSPLAVEQRVTALSQTFTYRIYNNAMKMIKYSREVTWFIWITAADDRVCPLCEPHHMQRFKPWWFMPMIPLHVGCRCLLEVEYEDIPIE